MNFGFTGSCTKTAAGKCTGNSAKACPGAYLGSGTTSGKPVQCSATNTGVSGGQSAHGGDESTRVVVVFQ